MDDDFDQKVWQTVAAVPKGKVASYGQIAKLIGYPSHSRHIGKSLGKLRGGGAIPWHRIVNQQGMISIKPELTAYRAQKKALIDEGVKFENEKINMRIYQWTC